MAYDKVVDSAVLEAGLTLIGDSIRAKGGTSAKLEFPNGMKAAVEAIDTSEDLDDVLAAQDTAITAQDDIISQIQVSVANKCLKPEQTKTATPSLSQQTIVPDSGKTLSGVTVEPITATLLTSLDADFNPENIAKDANLFGLIGTHAGGVSLDVITAASLPTAVVENQIVVITSTTPNTIYVDTNEPTNLVSGDLWVVVAKGDYGINFTEDTPYFSTKLSAVKQYNGSSWAGLDGYIGVSGTWQQFARSLPAIGTPLEQWTWEQIVILANSGEDVTQYFAVGDQKNLVLTTGEVVPVVIGDFNHNTITNSGGAKAPIAFTFKNCLNTTYAMNDSWTNAGGWDGSNMRKTHMVNIFNTFPAELRADGAVKYVDVVATAGSQSTSLVTSSDRLRLHSITELGLTYSYAGTEGTKYAYYASGNRVKTVNGTANYYWTRSPSTTASADFCRVSSSGAADRGYAGGAGGVACGFDI